MMYAAHTSTSAPAHAPLSPAEDGAPSYDVVVVGGGASGLAAAITAAKAGARVCIVERDVQAGLGLLATGNGRCNISNAKLDPRHYLHAHAARSVFGGEGEQRIASFFEDIGLMLAQEDEGRLYPLSKRAESVRDVLLDACAREEIAILSCANVLRARRVNEKGAAHWELALSVPQEPLSYKQGRDAKATIRNARKALAAANRCERTLYGASVIIAVGGRSQAICEVFSLPHLDETPVLCPVACTLQQAAGSPNAAAPTLDALDGLRAEGMLTLVRDGAAIAFEQGEVLFRPYGISGIAAFNLSRRLRPDDVIELDLFPTMNEADLLALLCRRVEAIGPFDGSSSWFDGMLASPLGAVIARLLTGADDPLRRAATLLHRIPLTVGGTTEHAQAHVHRGGVPLSAVDLATCAVTHQAEAGPRPGLFACGEALDMDADCGGFNLAWAWATGMRAGASAAKGLS